jgi:hypothetical protein
VHATIEQAARSEAVPSPENDAFLLKFSWGYCEYSFTLKHDNKRHARIRKHVQEITKWQNMVFLQAN